jgi:hypothetical protein
MHEVKCMVRVDCLSGHLEKLESCMELSQVRRKGGSMSHVAHFVSALDLFGVYMERKAALSTGTLHWT